MVKPKIWKTGIADETCKVVVCARDYDATNRCLDWLSHYLTGAVGNESEGLEEVRKMSGEQIVNALEEHKRVSLLSVQRGLGIAGPQE